MNNLYGIRDFIGITHAGASYCFGEESCLVEGAKKVRQLGSKTIKLWLSSEYRKLYSFNTDWTNFTSSVQLLESPYFAEALDLDFNTIVMEAFPLESSGIGDIHDNFSQRYLDAEFEGMYAITCHLLKKYENSGKTFILQNWEADWYVLRKGQIGNLDADPELSEINHFIDWINCRQNAVEKARSDCRTTGVEVLHALELNLARRAVNKRTSIGRNVVPNTSVDLLSYSAYDSLSDRSVFSETIDYLSEIAPPGEVNGRRCLYLGEFGYPNNLLSDAETLKRLDFAVDISYKKNLLHAIYWELYCNEPTKEISPECDKNNSGYWLIKPSGEKAVTYHYFEKLLE